MLNQRLLQHSLFWILAFILLAGFFAKEYGAVFSTLNLVYTLLFLWSIALVVYLNLQILIPRLLRKGYWWSYGLGVLLLLALGIALHFFTFDYWSDWWFPNFYFISYYSIRDVFNFLVIFLSITTLLKLAKGWFELNEQKKKVSQLEKEKLDAELSALKSQINPHFLFNSLNSMYSLSLDQDAKLPDLLLKLSAGMRYMLYETNSDFVPLEKEIEYLNNYLDLQKLRIEEELIEYTVEGKVARQKVAPLIFLPFVENAFKHGIKGAIENGFVRIKIEIGARDLLFTVENNRGEATVLPTEKHLGGVGLENVKKRLQLLYADQCQLRIKEMDERYLVQLKIPLR